MDTQLLIDNIVRQTTVLIAQLATSSGGRAPLSHVAGQVFLELLQELRAQGLGNKVIADPVQRYVNALKNPRSCPQNPDLSVVSGCVAQTNPLYDDLSTSDPGAKKAARSPSQIFLAGIVGVPWQDLAEDPAPGAALKLRKSVEPTGAGINWGVVAGCYGLTQCYAKASPAIRELQVLYGHQSNSIVASICPKVTDDTDSPEYGYIPAVAAIVDRLKDQLKPAL